MNRSLPLYGCAPTPIAAYLKALGIFRILSTQLPESAPKAFWQGNTFHLLSSLDSDDLINFFLHKYAPSPIVAPWNGGSGFYKKNKSKKNLTELELIEQSTAIRFRHYRETITTARSIIKTLGLEEKPNDEDKKKMRLYCRNQFSDIALNWIDSVFVLTEKKTSFPPLLGS